MNERKIIKSVSIVFFVLILAKIVAFVNDAVLAACLGISSDADAFYTVMGIQQVIYPMLSVGIWNVFLPEYKKNIVLAGSKKADVLANKLILLFTGISLAVAGAIFLFSKQIVMVCAPGLTKEVSALCSELLQISAPLYVFVLLSAIIATMLQCHERFLGSQIREVASHIPTIVIAVFLYDKFGVKALAYGLVLGSLLRLLVELPFINWGYHFSFVRLQFNMDEIRMLKKMPEALVTAGVEQINVLADKIIASLMEPGSISALNYAQKLVNVFSGLFGTAIGTALYPQMVECVARKEYRKVEEIITQSIFIISFLMIPITIGSIFFAGTIIECVFQRGEFGSTATELTAMTYQFYIIGLIFIAIKAILTNVLYSFGDTRNALRVSICTVCTNIILNLILSFYMGIRGLALATAVASIVNVYVSLWFLRKYIRLPSGKIYKEVIKTIIAAMTGCFAAYLCLLNLKMDNPYISIITAIAICSILYGAIMYFTKSESMELSIRYIKKLGKTR